MRRIRLASLGLLLVLTLPFQLAFANDPPPLPTSQQLQQMVDSGEYPDALAAISRILALKGRPAQSYDRLDVQRLRGECFLQMHQFASAIQALQAAQKEDSTGIQLDTNFDVAALLELIRNSTAGIYKSIDGQSFNILNPAQRKAPCGQLYKAEIADFLLQTSAAGKATTLPQLVQVARLGCSVQALEHVSTSAGKITDPLMDSLSQRITALITADLKDKFQDAHDIVFHATNPWQETVSNDEGDGWETTTHVMGFTDDDRRNLSSIRGESTKLAAAVSELQELFITHRADYAKLAIGAKNVYLAANSR